MILGACQQGHDVPLTKKSAQFDTEYGRSSATTSMAGKQQITLFGGPAIREYGPVPLRPRIAPGLLLSEK